MTVSEEFIKQVNEERKQKSEDDTKGKNVADLMKWCKELYDGAINAGFNNEQSMQYAYGYYYNTLFPVNKETFKSNPE